jgi:hypothetical protein
VHAVSAELGELPVDPGDLGTRVGRDGSGDGSPLGFEAGVVEGSSHPCGSAVVVFDGEGFGGGGAGVDGPARPVVDRPVAGEVFDGLLDAVGDDMDGVALAPSAHGDVAELPSAAVFEAVSDVDRRSLGAMHDQRNAKLVLNVVVGGDGSGYDLYRRRAPGERGC